MDLLDDIFTHILSFANDENEVKSTNRTENIGTTAEITMSPIERALKEVDIYLKENENGIDDIINGRNIHDSFKQLDINIREDRDTIMMPDSPRPGEKRKSTNLVCNRHDYERTGLGVISKSCRLAIRKYIDDRRNVHFEYCPELDHTTKNEVKDTESQTDIMDPAILITLPKSQKVALTLKHSKYI